MNFFDQLASKDMPSPDEAEVRVDLSGMEKDAALQKLDTIVVYCKKTSARTLYVSFDPARPGAGETLFQPVARYFKIEKFNKYVITALPVMTAERGGFFVTFRF